MCVCVCVCVCVYLQIYKYVHPAVPSPPAATVTAIAPIHSLASPAARGSKAKSAP